MKKIMYGKLFKFLILLSSISILAACSASDALDLADDIDNVNNGSEILGNITVSGADASAIGSSFSPTVDGTDDSINGVGFIVVALGDVDVNILSQSSIARALALVFSAGGVPESISYAVDISDGNLDYRYVTDCNVNDCSGISINTTTNTITLASVVLFNDPSNGSVSTANITLNGSTRYRAQ